MARPFTRTPEQVARELENLHLYATEPGISLFDRVEYEFAAWALEWLLGEHEESTYTIEKRLGPQEDE